jgi:hypothetical protein
MIPAPSTRGFEPPFDELWREHCVFARPVRAIFLVQTCCKVCNTFRDLSILKTSSKSGAERTRIGHTVLIHSIHSASSVDKGAETTWDETNRPFVLLRATGYKGKELWNRDWMKKIKNLL